jgi:ATP-dependent HslUV protease ATP-binding subunit HslU
VRAYRVEWDGRQGGVFPSPGPHVVDDPASRELNKHIVGRDAPSAPSPSRRTAGGASSRDPLRQEITPKNILMIGPTGVGKEIAAGWRSSPTPVHQGRGDQVTRSATSAATTRHPRSAETAIRQTRESEARKVRDRAADAAEGASSIRCRLRAK